MSITPNIGEFSSEEVIKKCPECASWHYGKDSKNEVSGAPFNVTFSTWSRTLGRIYLKREINRVRAEEIQAPNLGIQGLLEQVLHDGLDKELK